MHITARNYASQAAESLRHQAKTIRRNTTHDAWLKDVSQLEFLAGQLDKSVHFAMPDGGKIFDDQLKGIEGDSIRMPFPLMTIEWFLPDGGILDCGSGLDLMPVKKRLVLVQDFGEIVPDIMDGICFSTFIFNQHANMWIASPVFLRIGSDDAIPYQSNNRDGVYRLNGRLGIFMPEMYRRIYKLEPNPSSMPEGPTQDVIGDVGNALELFEALSCSNVSHEPIETIDPRKNAKRIKAGKLPIYETRILTIDSGKSSQSGMAHGGTHASPRQHLRRGHIRRLPDKNVWVNSCVVGRAEHGVIEKQYHVR